VSSHVERNRGQTKWYLDQASIQTQHPLMQKRARIRTLRVWILVDSHVTPLSLVSINVGLFRGLVACATCRYARLARNLPIAAI
jgi:hypothetical protein